MTKKEMQEMMEFIIKQQAEISIQQATMVQRQEEFEIRFNNKLEALLEQQSKTDSEVHNMVKRQEESEIKFNNKLETLLEQQSKTDSEVQALTNAIATLAIQADQDRAIMQNALKEIVSLSR